MFRKVPTANMVETQTTRRKLNREFSQFKRPIEAGYSIGSLSFSVRVNGAKGMLTLRQNELLQLKLDLTNMLPRQSPHFPLFPVLSIVLVGADKGEKK